MMRSRFEIIFLLPLIFLLVNCSVFVDHSKKQDYFKSIVLTTEVIEKYDLSLEELSQLQYFLGDTLILKNQDSTMSKQITDDLALTAQSNKEENYIFLQKNTPGIAVRVYKLWQEDGNNIFQKLDNILSRKRNEIIMRVSFNNDPSNYLVYQPNGKGLYTVKTEKDSTSVRYGAKKYIIENGKVNSIYFKINERTQSLLLRTDLLNGRRLRRIQS
jgi:hypothetical protein